MKFSDLVKKHKIKTLVETQQLLNGKKIRIIARTSNHGFPYGDYTVNSVGQSYPTGTNPYLTLSLKEFPNLGMPTLYNVDFEILLFSTKADFETEISSLRKQISDNEKLISKYDERLRFMDANNLDEFSEEDFKILNALDYIEDNKLTRVEKAKAIGKMLKGEEV